MISVVRSVAVALAFAAWTQGVSAQEVQLSAIDIQRLAVDVRNDPQEYEFTVVDSRMDETATAAVFFGMVGAAINSATNDAEDDAKEEPLRATAGALNLDGLITSALVGRLENRATIGIANTPAEASHTLVVEIGEWGLVRRSQRPDTAMRAFLKLNLTMLDARGRRIWGPQREHSVGQLSAELAAFTPEVFQAEMEVLAARAGQQVANRVIYR